MVALKILYVMCLIGVTLFGFDSLLIVFLYLCHRRDRVPIPPAPAEWPFVTVQLPIYNEMYTAERLLRSVARLRYPRARLEIQVLDDSTDETRPLMAEAVRRLQEQGLNVVHITRPDRTGYKAGALAAGLAQAKGELIAIFDADFCPQPEFLRRVVPHFRDPGIGCVQTRWGHTNRDYSLLTRIQALGLDAIFLVEQLARSRSGLFLNFNGSAGIWRRAAIEQAGGWQSDTLSEDLDLSYRAQLRGWRIAYLPDVVAPGEVPVEIQAFKKQQARWAEGSIQVVRKLAGPILRSERPWYVKVEGLVHLCGYLVHPLVLLLTFLTLALSFTYGRPVVVGPWVMIAGLGAPLFYMVGQVFEDRRWPYRVSVLPLAILLGIGLALNDTWAILKVFLGRPGAFQRTPKYALRSSRQAWMGNAYALRVDALVWVELAFALLLLSAAVLYPGGWKSGVWLVLYAASFTYISGLSLQQSRERRRWLSERSRSPVRTGRAPWPKPKRA